MPARGDRAPPGPGFFAVKQPQEHQPRPIPRGPGLRHRLALPGEGTIPRLHSAIEGSWNILRPEDPIQLRATGRLLFCTTLELSPNFFRCKAVDSQFYIAS